MARAFAKSFYRSKEWAAVRDYALKRDRYLCVLCGKPAQEVHHIVHLNPKNIYDVTVSLNPDNLMCLCRDCHFSVHKKDKLNGLQKNKKTKDCDDGYEFVNGILTKTDTPPIK